MKEANNPAIEKVQAHLDQLDASLDDDLKREYPVYPLSHIKKVS